MSASPLKLVRNDAAESPDPALLDDAAAWLTQLIRTLKTCRLYDEANPTVVRFREDLGQSLAALLARTGTLRLEVSSSALCVAGHEVQVARSRDDNLAAVFHRDGIRQLSLEPGIEAREIDALVDQILRVTGPAAGDEDLVTLLWDADLPHVTLETVPIEGEADGGGDDSSDETAAAAWPRQETGATLQLVGGTAPATGGSRSDDWRTDEAPSDLDKAFDELESVALVEIARFSQEQKDAAARNPVIETLRVVQDCLTEDLSDEDRQELAAFVPRVLREALALGDWRGASTALRLLRVCDPQWPVADFAAGLCGPFAITTRKVVVALDRDPKDVESFLALARELGPPAAEWMMHVLADSQQMHVRRPLARAIADLVAGAPERILTWLTDDRWYVVRNVVHILGWIGGNGIASHLRPASTHPEPRVRREVIAALAQVEAEASRPILTAMLSTADSTTFGPLLAQLALDSHASITQQLMAMLADEAFDQRPTDEKRALFRALATRGNAVLPALEAELNRGGLLSRRPEPDRPAIALCVARIGTPEARAIIERGLRSRNPAIRKACTIAEAAAGSQLHD